jgi:hypothetical protein
MANQYDLYQLWSKLIDLLEAGVSIYDEEVDILIDAIEDRLAKREMKEWPA